MPGGAALELEIAIPQHRKTFETCQSCIGGNECRRRSLAKHDRMRMPPKHPMNGGPSYAPPRAGAVFFWISGCPHRVPANENGRQWACHHALRCRLEVAILPLPGRFQGILSRRFVDVPALGAFEDPQIRTAVTRFDAGQHHATLAGRAEWPQYRNERWFETSISFGHGDAPATMAGARCTPKPAIAADSTAATEQTCRAPLSATVQYCSHSQKIAGRLGEPVRPVSADRSTQDCSPELEVSAVVFRAVPANWAVKG